jgi:hypothetical protein
MICSGRRFAALAISVAFGTACAPAGANRAAIRVSAPVNTVTFTPATNSAPPGAILPITGRCGSDTTFGYGYASIFEHGATVYTFLPGLPLDANGNYHAGLLIAPNEPLGTRTFIIDCYGEGTHASGTEGRFPFNVAGNAVDDYTITAQPSSGSPGTHVTLHGTGCILEGTPLETAHLLFGFENPARAENLDLHVPVGPDGTWTTSFTVPPNITLIEPGFFEATCEAPGTRIGTFESHTIFSIDSIPPPTTASTATSTTTSTTLAPQQPALPRTG